jgi:membrane protein YqaA with SNARE-associated domain
MRRLFFSVLGYFLTPAGLVVMGALDSSMVFFLPLGIDFVVILLAARKPDLFWLYAILATIGSLIGAAGTFWIGRKVGEHGLSKLVKPSRLASIQARVGNTAAFTIASLAIIPPPFPFTAFVLTSAASHVNAGTFFTTLAAVRALRFLAEGALAAHYGRGLLAWMQSPTFKITVGIIAGIAVVGTIASAIAVYRSTRRGERRPPKKVSETRTRRRSSTRSRS